MSEGLLTDSVATNGQAASAPAPDESRNEMGMGFLGPDTPGAAPDDADAEQPGEGNNDGQQAAQTPTDEADAEEERRAGLRLQDYTRKTQDLAEERRQFQQERQQFLQEMQALRQQQTQAQQQAQQALQAPAGGKLHEQIQQALNNPNLTAEDRAGLGVIGQMAQTMEDQQSTIAELKERLGQWEPQFREVSQRTQAIERERQQAQVQHYRTQLDESISLHGQQDTEAAIPFVRRNLGLDNPKTGKAYTVAELVGLWHQKPLEQQQAARAGNRQVQQRAKQQLAPGGAHAPTEAAGVLSREQALAEISATL